MFQRPSESRFPNGGIIRDNTRIDNSLNQRMNSGTAVSDEDIDQEVTIFKPLQRADLGPIGKLAPSTTLYDLFLSNAPDIVAVREMFHDWTFPTVDIVSADETKAMEKRIHPVRNICRGRVGSTDFRVEQFVYAILNPNLFPVSGFGTTDLMAIDRTSILVCINACDPRYGNLNNAFVQYAVRMSAPVASSVRLAGCDMIDTDGQSTAMHYFNLEGDMKLEETISNDWFNTQTYKFNGVIYPLISRYNNFVVDVKPVNSKDM